MLCKGVSVDRIFLTCSRLRLLIACLMLTEAVTVDR